MKILVREAFGYSLVSGISLIVDLTLLWILVHYCGWWYLAAGTASFLAGLAVESPCAIPAPPNGQVAVRTTTFSSSLSDITSAGS